MADTTQRTNNPVILVVEDDPPVRELLQDVLDEAEYEIVAVPDGATALQVIRTLHVDVITLDLDLPGLTGSEFLQLINSRTTQVPPVIIISSTAPVSRELQAQATAVLTKPFDIDDLIAKIRMLVSEGASDAANKTEQPSVE